MSWKDKFVTITQKADKSMLSFFKYTYLYFHDNAMITWMYFTFYSELELYNFDFICKQIHTICCCIWSPATSTLISRNVQPLLTVVACFGIHLQILLCKLTPLHHNMLLLVWDILYVEQCWVWLSLGWDSVIVEFFV